MRGTWRAVADAEASAGANPICITAAPGAWDTPAFCAEVAKMVAALHPGRHVWIANAHGRVVAGFVPDRKGTTQ